MIKSVAVLPHRKYCFKPKMNTLTLCQKRTCLQQNRYGLTLSLTLDDKCQKPSAQLHVDTNNVG